MIDTEKEINEVVIKNKKDSKVPGFVNKQDRIKLSLDATILQSNTVIDLIAYIIRQRDHILNLKSEYEDDKKGAKIYKAREGLIMSDALERILKVHTTAMKRRAGRSKYESDWLDN